MIRLTQVFAAARAYLDDPLPYRVESGDEFSLSVSPTSEFESGAAKYDLWLPVGNRRAAGTFTLDGTLYVPDLEGTYRLRFYFPQGKQYRIYPGPEVRITQSP